MAEEASRLQSAGPLLALAVGAFGIGVTEFAPMGLLPEIAAGLHVSLARAGILVSAYALGVMAGAPTMTLLLARLRQKHALLLLMLVFIVGNGLAALMPGFGALMAARILTSLAHGAFFGIGAVLAASLVSSERRASAVATMFMGLTVANVGGVPAATWVGQAIGWRTTFAAIAGLGAAAMLALGLALPTGERCGAPDVRRELRALTSPAMLVALATTVAGAGAMFTTYTFIAPMLRELGRASAAMVTWSLVAIGTGFSIGNWVAGRVADRAPTRSLVVFLAFLAALSAVLPFALASPATGIVALTAWGAAAFGVVPPVQTLVMRRATDAPGLASSVNIGAFNIGNALGAFLGGRVLQTSLGFRAVAPAGAVLAMLGILLALLGKRQDQAAVATA